MANATGGLFQTLVAAASLAQQELRFRNAFLDAIFWDTKPDPVQPYTGLNVIIPSVDESDVVDIQAGPLQPADTVHSNVQIPFNLHYSSSFVIKVWDAVRTPVDLKQKYVQPKLEGLMRKVNRTITNQVNATNFSNYTLISGATAGEIVRADISAAWANIANAGAPVDDDGNMFLLESVGSFGKQIADANFINQYIVGDSAATQMQQQAKMKTQYGCEVRWDQHLPTGLFASAKEPAIMMHRYAIAGVTAPLMPLGGAIKETVFKLKGVLPVQMQMQESLKDQGWLVNLHCWWGIKVVRPELGSILQSA